MKLKQFKFEFDGYTVNCQIRRDAFNTNLLRELREFSEPYKAIKYFIEKTVDSWDVFDDGKRLEVNSKNLGKMPIFFLEVLSEVLFEKFAPPENHFVPIIEQINLN